MTDNAQESRSSAAQPTPPMKGRVIAANAIDSSNGAGGLSFTTSAHNDRPLTGEMILEGMREAARVRRDTPPDLFTTTDQYRRAMRGERFVAIGSYGPAAFPATNPGATPCD